MSWLICLAVVALFFFLINRIPFFKISFIPVLWINLALISKILAGIALIWIYTSIYPIRSESDLFKYYDDGLVLNEILTLGLSEYATAFMGSNELEIESQQILKKTKHWDKTPSVSFLNDNRLVIRFNSLLALFTKGNFYTHMFVAGFLAFIGQFLLFHCFLPFCQGKARWLFLVIFLTPSVLLWTSGVLKEAFMMLGLGGLFFSSFQLIKKPFSVFYFLGAMAFTLLLLGSKMYLFLVFIPSIVFYFWAEKHQDGKNSIRLLVLNLLFIALLINLKYLSPTFDFVQTLIQKQSEFKCLADWVGAGSSVFIPDLKNNVWSFLLASPYALYNSLMRPGIFDLNNPLSLLAALEIGLVWIILVISIYHKNSKSINFNLVFFILNFVVLLSLLIGWTTPVLGAIVRYRIPSMLMLLILSVHLVDPDKIKILHSKFKPNR